MADFTQRMRLRGKAAEDIYFAEQERKLLAARHEKEAKQLTTHIEPIDEAASKNNAHQHNSNPKTTE
ncbi:hypothetical protein [Psychromonas antarctica]|uniref:hypothetical protein n=1 Tax=Psychromonas antarctica TaxID=67573 RepID=UPI001EE93EDD|nr:hypothetical protein [Psychromonas antarctica]MCG6201885.1 hypothetical protein [Psychromonas antarctica]